MLIYRFHPDWSGQIVVESVGADFPAVLEMTIHDPCFGSYYAQLYHQGRVRAIAFQQSELYSRVQPELIERQRIEQELRVSEERYRSVVTAMSEGIVLQQADGQITAAKPFKWTYKGKVLAV